MVVVYRGATLLDGTGAPARPGVTLVVAGEEIRLVAPDAEVDAGAYGAEAAVVELAGAFVVPGLIDSHQHIATPPDRPLAEATLRRDLYGGVTATRDMADDLRQVADLARAALVGEIAAPDIHYAALMAGPSFFEDPRTWQVSQGATPGAVPWMQAVGEETDLPLAVAMARGTYATAIKIYANLPGETVAAITAEAHRQGIAVWAHGAVFPATPGEVVAAGVDSVSHVQLLVHAAAEQPLTTYQQKPPIDYERFAAGDDACLAELFAEMRRRGTILDATASLWSRIAAEAEDEESRARAEANDGLSAALTAQAFRAGVTVCAGTDRDPDPGEEWPPLFDELAYLVERCGFTPEQALESATRAGAASMGAESRMGTVEAGKLANFLVLDEDPTKDIRDLRSLRFVVKRGRRHDRADYRPGHPPRGDERHDSQNHDVQNHDVQNHDVQNHEQHDEQEGASA
ncbi:amidohydrolase family protein [Streptacidiphilus rugosus]|uniref:amidohydrolase family protein n=1 Tax=Streptacidiphilus rugosus TaxID=405783 RepID=UPI0007C7ECFD|nr:amidohydrolase family protein [Streptacidiphilus rugosus]